MERLCQSLVVKTKFSLREDSRLLSALLPIVTLGFPLYIPVPSLNFYFITDIRCESPPGRPICYDLSPCSESSFALEDVLQGVLISKKGAPVSLNPLLTLHREVPSRAAHLASRAT